MQVFSPDMNKTLFLLNLFYFRRQQMKENVANSVGQNDEAITKNMTWSCYVQIIHSCYLGFTLSTFKN